MFFTRTIVHAVLIWNTRCRVQSTSGKKRKFLSEGKLNRDYSLGSFVKTEVCVMRVVFFFFLFFGNGIASKSKLSNLERKLWNPIMRDRAGGRGRRGSALLFPCRNYVISFVPHISGSIDGASWRIIKHIEKEQLLDVIADTWRRAR